MYSNMDLRVVDRTGTHMLFARYGKVSAMMNAVPCSCDGLGRDGIQSVAMQRSPQMCLRRAEGAATEMVRRPRKMGFWLKRMSMRILVDEGKGGRRHEKSRGGRLPRVNGDRERVKMSDQLNIADGHSINLLAPVPLNRTAYGSLPTTSPADSLLLRFSHKLIFVTTANCLSRLPASFTLPCRAEAAKRHHRRTVGSKSKES
jgi:hypothetical protein